MYNSAVSSSPGQSDAPSSPVSVGRRSERVVVAYVAVVVAAVVYSFLALRRVWELKANAFDAAFLDNVLYKVSVGLGDMSGLMGVRHFVDHTSVLLLGAVPVYWINADAGYPVLLVLQSVSVAMVGLAAWLIADTIGLSGGRKIAVLLYVLASPAAYWAIITELHMTGLSMGLVAMTIAGAYRRWRISWYWVLPLLASLARIEIAVTVVVVGLLLLGVSRRHALVSIVVGVAVTVMMAVFIMVTPDQAPTTSIYFDYLGVESVSELPFAMLRNPGAVLGQVLQPLFVLSLLVWFIMIGTVLPLRASRWILVGVPMLLVAALSSPLFADLWYLQYWNLLFVGVSVAFVLSLAVWSFSDRTAIVLVVGVLCTAWFIAGPTNGPLQFKMIYPSASSADHQAATIAASTIGAMSATREMVLPGAHREWIYEFPNPFACREYQYAGFLLAGPAPEVVITTLGWEDTVRGADVDGLRRTLSEDYEVTHTIGPHTVRQLVRGATPVLVDACEVSVSG